MRWADTEISTAISSYPLSRQASDERARPAAASLDDLTPAAQWVLRLLAVHQKRRQPLAPIES